MATVTEKSDLMLGLFGEDFQQAVMKANSNFAGMFQRGSQTFWQHQNELLNIMESFANSWFERRRVGVQAALEAADRMCQAATPQACLGECQKWATGAFERVMADSVACQSEFGKFVQGVAPSLAPAISDSQQVGAEIETRKPTRISGAA